MGKSILVTSMADEDAIRIQSDYVTLKGFTIDADSQTDHVDYLSCIIVSSISPSYLTLEDLELKNAGELGINYGGLSHSTFKNIYAHDNAENAIHGNHSVEGTGVYNTFRDIYCWDNGEQGFSDGTDSYVRRDSHNVYDNIQCWDNGWHGISLTRQTGIILTNSVSYGNTDNGIYLRDIENSTISNCSVTDNGKTGLFLTAGVKNVNFTNVIVKNNKTGISIHNSSELVFTSCQSYDDRETPLQDYGLYLTGTNTGISLLNCKLTPNKEGDIYNPAGAVVTVITEKMLAKF
jgi:parallel beta-helix repeat protein